MAPVWVATAEGNTSPWYLPLHEEHGHLPKDLPGNTLKSLARQV